MLSSDSIFCPIGPSYNSRKMEASFLSANVAHDLNSINNVPNEITQVGSWKGRVDTNIIPTSWR